MEKNVLFILVSRIFRSLPLGYMAFLVPLYLHYLGFSPSMIGVYFLVATLSISLYLVLGGFLGDAFGKRNILVLFSLLFSVNFAIFAFSYNPYLLFITALLGVGVGSGGGVGGGAGGGPFNPLQTSLIAQFTHKEELTKVYSYNFAASTISAFAGSLIADYVSRIVTPYHILFLLGLLFSLISVVFTFLIDRDQGTGKIRIPKNSYSSISKISIAGSLGSLGLGMIMPLIPLWFKLYFHATELQISYLYSASYALVGISFIFSARIEKILGRVNAIVIMRGLSSIILILMAFSPYFFIVEILFLLRSIMYTVTIPMRQSLSMDVFSETERATGVSITGLARRLPYGAGSLVSGILLCLGLFLSALFLGGLISILDPILYYIFFRKIQ